MFFKIFVSLLPKLYKGDLSKQKSGNKDLFLLPLCYRFFGVFTKILQGFA